MVGPAALVTTGLALTVGLARPQPGVGEGLSSVSAPPASGTTAYTQSGRLFVAELRAYPPDTSRRALAADTVRALVPDAVTEPTEAPPTRKTTLFTALAIAVLTISTLLLYNVRSR